MKNKYYHQYDYKQFIADLGDYDRIMEIVRKFHWQRKNNHAFVINILSMVCFIALVPAHLTSIIQALSQLFSGYTQNLQYLREACFEVSYEYCIIIMTLTHRSILSGG